MTDIRTTTGSNPRYDSAQTDGNERHSLQTYVSDLLALTKHIEVPIDRQLNLDDAANYAEAIAIVREIKSVTEAQRIALETQLAALGGHAAAGIKSAVSAFLGAAAAAVNSARTTKVSKSLRDDYTALSLASISYTMLHATALGLGDTAVAALAHRHLEQLTPIIVRISKAISSVVLQELRDDGEAVSVSAAERSAQQTHEAWQQR